LERLPGVKRADVRLETEEARVVFDDAKQTPEKLAAAIDRLGFQASMLSVTAAPRPTLLVEGVNDLKAVRKIEAVLRGLKGIRGVRVDPGTGEVFVEYDGPAVSPQLLLSALQSAGFNARLAPAP
jgi:copper chaperone CopZ